MVQSFLPFATVKLSEEISVFFHYWKNELLSLYFWINRCFSIWFTVCLSQPTHIFSTYMTHIFSSHSLQYYGLNCHLTGRKFMSQSNLIIADAQKQKPEILFIVKTTTKNVISCLSLATSFDMNEVLVNYRSVINGKPKSFGFSSISKMHNSA